MPTRIPCSNLYDTNTNLIMQLLKIKHFVKEQNNLEFDYFKRINEIQLCLVSFVSYVKLNRTLISSHNSVPERCISDYCKNGN